MAINLTSRLAALAALFAGLACSSQILAAPALVIDAASGEILHQEEATRPWFPASVTKLMTVYVALNAVRSGRITLQTPLLVSARAARAAPSKMGFKPGVEVTLENALKIIMVKSANDTSITIAEGVAGSVEAFAAEMNETARRMGMRDSNFVNPNGLHHPSHVSSARDMAILARRLLQDFPQHSDLYGIGALQLGKRIIPTHNGLIGRYPGADGMKTGFVCASGFNMVATATRGGRKLIAVVMGAPNARVRTLQAMALFDASFAIRGQGNVEAMGSTGGSAPDMRPEICGRGRNQEGETPIPIPAQAGQGVMTQEDSAAAFFLAERNRGQGAGPAQGRTMVNFSGVGLGQRDPLQPVPIYVGRAPGWTGRVAGPTGRDPETGADASAANKRTASQPLDLRGGPTTVAARGAALARPPVRAGAPAQAQAKTKAQARTKAQAKTKAQPKGKAKPQQAASRRARP